MASLLLTWTGSICHIVTSEFCSRNDFSNYQCIFTFNFAQSMHNQMHRHCIRLFVCLLKTFLHLAFLELTALMNYKRFSSCTKEIKMKLQTPKSIAVFFAVLLLLFSKSVCSSTEVLILSYWHIREKNNEQIIKDIFWQFLPICGRRSASL